MIDKSYKVAFRDYVSLGGDGFTMVKEAPYVPKSTSISQVLIMS